MWLDNLNMQFQWHLVWWIIWIYNFNDIWVWWIIWIYNFNCIWVWWIIWIYNFNGIWVWSIIWIYNLNDIWVWWIIWIYNFNWHLVNISAIFPSYEYRSYVAKILKWFSKCLTSLLDSYFRNFAQPFEILNL